MLTLLIFILRLVVFAISTAAQSGQQVAAGTQKRLGGPGGSAGMLKGRAGAAQGKAISTGTGPMSKMRGGTGSGIGKAGKPGTGGKRKPGRPMGAAAIYRSKDRKAAAGAKRVAAGMKSFTNRAGRF